MPTTTFHNLTEAKKQRIIKASFNEFSNMPFEQVKLSEIIRNSKIPRGSFYQYFEDKTDLYKYLFDIISKKKIDYMGDITQKPDEIPFLDLFRILYVKGLDFTIENPIYYKTLRYLLDTRGTLYNELMGDGLKFAKEFYINYVEADKALGRIREEVDSDLLADLFIEATTNITLEGITNNQEIVKEKMLKRVDGLIEILKKGIE